MLDDEYGCRCYGARISPPFCSIRYQEFMQMSSTQNLAAWCACLAPVECLMNFRIFRFFSRSEARGHQFRKRL